MSGPLGLSKIVFLKDPQVSSLQVMWSGRRPLGKFRTTSGSWVGSGLRRVRFQTKVTNGKCSNLGGGFKDCLMFIPILGEMIQLDEHIFSDGVEKNHQLGMFWSKRQ